MEITTVKENGQGGYLVNGTISVPNAEGNRHYKMVQEWIVGGGTVAPFETQAEIDARVIQEANQTELALLDQLDRESIRDIREWIAAQATAPQTLKDREAQAIAARGRLQ
jgi:hypothetical protein